MNVFLKAVWFCCLSRASFFSAVAELDTSALEEALSEQPVLVDRLTKSNFVSSEESQALALLAEQAIRRGIDYASLSLGWNHPTSRIEYREATHKSITCSASRLRQQRSKSALTRTVQAILEGQEKAQDAIAELFLQEIGAKGQNIAPTWAAIVAALENELLLPLRALNEGQQSMSRTFNGQPVPRQPIAEAVRSLTTHVVQGTFKNWRYTNPVGQRQLQGLLEWQKEAWKESTSMTHGKLRTHEDEPDELGLFWATKIGGPSHGFDIEGQCLLPLLCNARHKVILVTDPAWPHNPAGRAHFRLLWTATTGQPILWLETVNKDFRANVDTRAWAHVVLTHAVAKAVNMGVTLWVPNNFEGLLSSVSAGQGEVRRMQDRLVLRPSNGVVEASDYLSHKHDWPQMNEETTDTLLRTAFIPATLQHDEI
eukprot:gene3409-4288_t